MENNYDLSKFDKVMSDVKEIEEKGNFVPDCTTKEGYEASKRFVLDITTPARKRLTEAHQEVKKPFLETCRFLDAKKKELMPLLEKIEAPHKEAYKAVDEEKKRIKAEKEAAVQRGFDSINHILQSSVGANAETIQSLLGECADFNVDPEIYMKRTDELIALQSDAISKLSDALTKQIQFEEMEKQREEMERKQREIEAREQEALRQQQEVERKEREARIAEEARIEAERKAEEDRIKAAQEAELKLEREREQARIQAEEAEKKRIADIEAAKQAEIQRQQEAERLEREAAERREADKKHRAAINNGIVKVLVDNGLSEKDAKKVVTLVAKRETPNMYISY